MKSSRVAAKVFAVSILIFVNLVFASGQETNRNILPKGTVMQLSMDNGINSRFSSPDDTFSASVTEPVVIDEVVLVPIGTVVRGRILESRPARAAEKDGVLRVEFESLVFENGQLRQLDAELTRTLDPEKRTPSRWIFAGTGALAGALLGSASRSGQGALIGAGVGAILGTASSALRNGRNVGIESDERFAIRTRIEIEVPVTDF